LRASAKSKKPAKPAKPANAGKPAKPARAVDRPPKLDAAGLVVVRPGWREAIERTVNGLHYELVDVERAARGLLRVTIDRLPGHAYAAPSEFVIVEDCEMVTRQLQYSLEVDGVDYGRLEVSSPGLDRPLRREADYERFVGQMISISLKEPFEGRKVFKGLLGRADQADQAAGAQSNDAAVPALVNRWTLNFTVGKTEQVLGFMLEEVREARLVPVLDFKGRRSAVPADEPAAGAQASGVIGG